MFYYDPKIADDFFLRIIQHPASLESGQLAYWNRRPLEGRLALFREIALPSFSSPCFMRKLDILCKSVGMRVEEFSVWNID